MGTIWTSLMILSAVAALVCGKTGEAASALLASGSDAVTLMLSVHHSERAVAGVYSYDIARSKADKAMRLAREKADKVVLATNPLFPMAGQATRLSWNN